MTDSINEAPVEPGAAPMNVGAVDLGATGGWFGHPGN